MLRVGHGFGLAAGLPPGAGCRERFWQYGPTFGQNRNRAECVGVMNDWQHFAPGTFVVARAERKLGRRAEALPHIRQSA